MGGLHTTLPSSHLVIGGLSLCWRRSGVTNHLCCAGRNLFLDYKPQLANQLAIVFNAYCVETIVGYADILERYREGCWEAGPIAHQRIQIQGRTGPLQSLSPPHLGQRR